MGLTVEEYFKQKEACPHCVENHNEDHCVTTLLSRAENCFVYNIVGYKIGEYTQEDINLLKNLRSILPEQIIVDYYVRCDRLITKMNLLKKPFYEQYAIYNRINYNYIRKIVIALRNNQTDRAIRRMQFMLSSLEKENNIQGI